MQRFFPALAAIDLATAAPLPAAAATTAGGAAAPSPRLPSLTSLHTAHARLTAHSATRWTWPSRPSTRLPRPSPCRAPAAASALDLAYHPKGLPPAAALPSLTHPDGRPRVQDQPPRPQRSFAQVSSLLELMASAAGLEGEVRGTKVALRECSRLIDVAQPLAGAWLQAIPGPNQFRLRSRLT